MFEPAEKEFEPGELEAALRILQSEEAEDREIAARMRRLDAEDEALAAALREDPYKELAKSLRAGYPSGATALKLRGGGTTSRSYLAS